MSEKLDDFLDRYSAELKFKVMKEKAEAAHNAGIQEPAKRTVTDIVPNMPAAIFNSTAKTVTPERQELGEAMRDLRDREPEYRGADLVEVSEGIGYLSYPQPLKVTYFQAPAFRKQVNTHQIERAIVLLLDAIGEDPEREGLRETPARVAKFWKEFIEYQPGKTETTFSSVSDNQLVVVSGMRVWSLCEHHLLPFWTDVTVGYIAKDRVLGLSKFARIAHQFAHRLQTQENLGAQIADEVARVTDTQNVAVRCCGTHTCMTMRGIKTEGVMSNTVYRGVFQLRPSAREELHRLIQGK